MSQEQGADFFCFQFVPMLHGQLYVQLLFVFISINKNLKNNKKRQVIKKIGLLVLVMFVL